MPVIPNHTQIIPSVFRGALSAQKAYRNGGQVWPTPWHPTMLPGLSLYLDAARPGQLAWSGADLASWTDEVQGIVFTPHPNMTDQANATTLYNGRVAIDTGLPGLMSSYGEFTADPVTGATTEFVLWDILRDDRITALAQSHSPTPETWVSGIGKLGYELNRSLGSGGVQAKTTIGTLSDPLTSSTAEGAANLSIYLSTVAVFTKRVSPKQGIERWVNGWSNGPNANAAIVFDTTPGYLTVGCQPNAGLAWPAVNYSHRGPLAVLLCYDRALSDPEIALVHAWLHAEGSVVPGSNLFLSTGGTPYTPPSTL
jgi:hypothetical protein